MFKTVLFALVTAAGFFASPAAIDSKEQIPVLVEIARADVLPCAPMLVTVDVAAPKVKVKKRSHRHHQVKKEQTKKKHAAHGSHHHKSKVPHHNKSIPHHHSNGSTKIPTTLGPLHLTSPPGGCG